MRTTWRARVITNETIGWKHRPEIGERIRCTSRQVGERVAAYDGLWLHGGDVGVVVRVIPGYPRHRCHNHAKSPDCICGGGGWVFQNAAAPVVRYPNGIERCISPEDEGRGWERVRKS